MGEAPFTYGLYRCISGFLLGSICYKFILRMKDKVIPMASLFEIALIIGIYFFIVYAGANKYSLLAPILFTFSVFIFSFEQGIISHLLKIKFFQNLGKWSYSIYMLHAFIILVIGRGFNVMESLTGNNHIVEHTLSSGEKIELLSMHSPYLMDLLTVFYLISLVLIASVTYKYIEIRGNKLLSKIGMGSIESAKEIKLSNQINTP